MLADHRKDSRLWSLPLCRHSSPSWMCSCVTAAGDPGLAGRLDPQRFLPTLTNLWFCDSVMQSSGYTAGWQDKLWIMWYPKSSCTVWEGFEPGYRYLHRTPADPHFWICLDPHFWHCLVVFHPFTKWTESVTQWTVVQLFSVALYRWRIPKERVPRAKNKNQDKKTIKNQKFAYKSSKNESQTARLPQSSGQVKHSCTTCTDI